MIKLDLTPIELENCYTIASRESFETGREVRVEEIIIRELELAQLGQSNIIDYKTKYIEPVDIEPVNVIKSNVGKVFYIEYADGKVSKIKLVKDFDVSTVVENVTTTQSKVGTFLDTASEGDVFKYNDVEFIIVSIIDVKTAPLEATM
jgi:hypothetical protein